MGSGEGGLRAGRRFEDNIAQLTARFPLTPGGYFGKKGKGRGFTRNIESDNPAKTASEFAALAGYNPVTVTTIKGKGIVATMRDGSVVTHRFFSSSKDRSPTVELKIVGTSKVKSLKIHFVRKGH